MLSEPHESDSNHYLSYNNISSSTASILKEQKVFKPFVYHFPSSSPLPPPPLHTADSYSMYSWLRSEFLNFSTTDILGEKILCGGWLFHCRILADFLALTHRHQQHSLVPLPL